MKRTALLPVVVAFLLFGASSARAAPFTLTLIDVTGGTQTTLTAASLIFGTNITVGQFRVSGATGFLQEPAGSVTLNLSQLTVSDTNPSAPGAEFKAVLSLTGVDPGALGLGSNALATVTSTSNIPVLYTGAATVTAASWVDPSNGSGGRLTETLAFRQSNILSASQVSTGCLDVKHRHSYGARTSAKRNEKKLVFWHRLAQESKPRCDLRIRSLRSRMVRS